MDKQKASKGFNFTYPGGLATWMGRYLESWLGMKPMDSLSPEELIARRENLFPDTRFFRSLIGSPAEGVGIKEVSIPVNDHKIGGLVLTPEGDGPHPLIIYYHGGGFVLGRPRHFTGWASRVAQRLGAVVVIPDYRLAPEDPYPAAPEDACGTLFWAHGHASELEIDPDKIALMGGSAGGCLAAVVSQMCRDRKGPTIKRQVLIYPVTNGLMKGESFKENAKGPFLTTKDVEFFINAYSGREGDILEPYFSPFLAESLKDLPPCTLITAGHDPLRDDGKAYAERLRLEGVPVHYEHYPQVFHSFHMFTQGLREAKDCLELIVHDLEEAFK